MDPELSNKIKANRQSMGKSPKESSIKIYVNNIHHISKTLNDNSVPTKPRTNNTCFKFGKVIYQNSVKKFVPSIFEAS